MSVHPDPSTWPLTLDEAVARLLGRMSEADKAFVRRTAKDQLIDFHFGWAMGIWNEFGLWQGNAKLLASCGDLHPDSASMVIVEAVWQRLQDAEPGAKADGGAFRLSGLGSSLGPGRRKRRPKPCAYFARPRSEYKSALTEKTLA